MPKTTISEFEFLKLYDTEDPDFAFYEGLRWPDGRCCLNCNGGEIYETYVGGKERDKHNKYKLRAGQGALGKATCARHA